jgi:predicted HTH transcriptional regulator
LLERKPLDQIDKGDLQQLIDDQVQESKTIDYKLDAVGNSDKAKKDFLADVSSFANAVGGHLIYGISEEQGIPKQISGLVLDMDDEMARLDNIIRDGYTEF